MPDSAPTPEAARRGLILINTGPGKGKTTAALGTALRAAGNGMRVLILQFLKGSWHYGELDAADALNAALGARRAGQSAPRPRRTSSSGSLAAASSKSAAPRPTPKTSAWSRPLGPRLPPPSSPATGTWSCSTRSTTPSATRCSRPKPSPKSLRRKPEMVHVILTGRNAHPLLVELADTVTEMREVKHAYQRGILAQRGIEF